MISRRHLLGSAAIAPLLLLDGNALANAGGVVFSGARRGRQDLIVGINAALQRRFEIPVETRAHGFARHPSRPEAVGFARRPGPFAIVFDHVRGNLLHRITPEPGRHFYGHGVFSRDGHLLFTTENNFADGAGVIGVYDVDGGYGRIGEFSSGGTGPHEIIRLPGSDTLVVANGGIRTHPDTGRAQLNLETMVSSLAYLDGASGALTDKQLIAGWQQLSIRHLAIAAGGTVAVAMQHRGPVNERPPMLGMSHSGGSIEPVAIPAPLRDRLKNYIGSVAVDADQQLLASAPRANLFFRVDRRRREVTPFPCQDGCGIYASGRLTLFSSGQGSLLRTVGNTVDAVTRSDAMRWDNHLG